MTATTSPVRVRQVHQADERLLALLAELLVDAVDGGASVGFLAPLAHERALAWWRPTLEAAWRGERALLVAEDDAGLVGTVQLVLAQMENQPHRADLSKLLVHRRARRRGVGERLMHEAERVARAHGKTLLVLDTATPEAERLYRRLGWQAAGVIPGYALLPDGSPCDTVYFWRQLQPAA